MSKRGGGRFAGTYTASAYLHGLPIAVLFSNPNLLQVRQPSSSGFIMGVTDVVAGHGPLSANFATSGHIFTMF